MKKNQIIQQFFDFEQATDIYEYQGPELIYFETQEEAMPYPFASPCLIRKMTQAERKKYGLAKSKL